MPEGHSVARLAGALTELFGGLRPRVSSPQGRFAQGAAILDSMLLAEAFSFGKHLFVAFTDSPAPGLDIGDEGPVWLHVHLGLYGSWSFDGDDTFVAEHTIGAPRRKIGESEVVGSTSRTWSPPVPRDTVRVRLEIDSGVADLTGPNQCRILTGAGVRSVLDRLGPDPLRNELGDRAEFIRRVRRRSVAVGQLVMDQQVVAGPGNIYRAECLFRTGIHPLRPGKNVSATRLGHLWDDLVETMNEGKRDGVIVTNPTEYRRAADIAGGDETDRRFAVYQRTGRACFRCGAPVKMMDLAGRRLYWCGSCQR